MQSAVRLRWLQVRVATAALTFVTLGGLGCGGAFMSIGGGGNSGGNSGNSGNSGGSGGSGGNNNNNNNAHQIIYVGNLQANTVSGYQIKPNGSLVAVSGSPFALGGVTLVGDPSRKALFSLQASANTIQLNTISVNADGSLKLSSSITDITLAGVEAINPAGTVLYADSINAADDNRGWKVYSIQADGSLQFVDGLIDQEAGRLVFTPDGSAAFAASCIQLTPNIEQFAVAQNGMLTNVRNQIATPVSFGDCPNAVTLSPTGNMLAAAWSDVLGSDTTQNFITLFNIDPGTHELSPPAGSIFAASGAGQDITFDPSGKFIVTAQDNGIGVYEVGMDSLTEVKGSPFGGGEVDQVMFLPSGAFMAAVSGTAGQILVFSFDSSTGALTAAPGSPVSTPNPFDLAIMLQ